MQRSRAGEQALADPVRPRERDLVAAHVTTRLTGAIPRSVAATMAVAALLGYLALTPLAPFAGDTYANDLRRHIILGTIIAAYALALLAMRRMPARTPLDLPVLAVMAAIALGVAGSLDRRVSLEAVLPILPAIPLFYLVADHRFADADTLRRAVLIAGVTVACFALASVWRQWQGWLDLVRAVDGGVSRATLLPPSVPRVEGVGSHPNVLGAVLAIATPFFVLSFGATRRLERAAAAVGLVIALAALFFTLSRAAWVAAAAGTCVTAAGMVLGSGRTLRLRPVLGGTGVLVALALVAAAALGGARPDWLFRDSLDPRADMRRAGIEMFKERPLTGNGPGLYVALYPRHDGAYPFAAVHSHNVAVQIAADYGLAGLLAGALMLGATAALFVWRFVRGDAAQRRLVAGASGAVTAFLVHGLADAPHLFPEVLLLLAIAVGLVLRAGDERLPVRWRRVAGAIRLGSAVPVVAVLAGVVLIPLWWHNDRAAAEHQRSVRAAVAQRWDEAVLASRRAVDRDPRLAAYELQLGASYAARYSQWGDPSDRDLAIAAYERGLAREPRNGAALVDLATLKLEADDIAGARSATESLRQVAGRDELLQLAYAVLVQRTSTPEQAIETYAGLLVLNPTLALTPFWRDDEFRAAHYDAIVDRSLTRVEEITGPGAPAESLRTAIRVLTGRNVPNEQELRAAVASAPGDLSLQVALGRLLTAGGRRDEAEPLLRGAVERKSDSADAHAALGDWYAAGGDTPRARREWLVAAYLGDVRAMDALGESFPAGAVPKAVIERQKRLIESAAITRFYLPFQTFRFTFQRHEPVPIIRPGDWLNALPDEFGTWQEHLARWEEGKGKRE